MNRNLAAAGRSMVLNQSRQFHLECIANGVKVPGLEPDDEGYYCVSRHVAGMNSAWVEQTLTRNRYPNLKTKVVNTTHVDCEWNAEVRVKLDDNKCLCPLNERVYCHSSNCMGGTELDA